jgi:hypothetical protein
MCAVYADIERTLSRQPSPDFYIGICLIGGFRLGDSLLRLILSEREPPIPFQKRRQHFIRVHNEPCGYGFTASIVAETK